MLRKLFRSFIRSRMSPISEDRAAVWEKRFSLAYFLCAWNLLAFVAYQYYNREKLGIDYDPNEPTAERMARQGLLQNVKVFRFNNLSFEGTRQLENHEVDRGIITYIKQQSLDERKDEE